MIAIFNGKEYKLKQVNIVKSELLKILFDDDDEVYLDNIEKLDENTWSIIYDFLISGTFEYKSDILDMLDVINYFAIEELNEIIINFMINGDITVRKLKKINMPEHTPF